jgi:hypothetical protein
LAAHIRASCCRPCRARCCVPARVSELCGRPPNGCVTPSPTWAGVDPAASSDFANLQHVPNSTRKPWKNRRAGPTNLAYYGVSLIGFGHLTVHDTPERAKNYQLPAVFRSTAEISRRDGPIHDRTSGPIRAKSVHTLGFSGIGGHLGMTGAALRARVRSWVRPHNTLAFCAHNQGVGFAIVARRGYGRRRWPDYPAERKRSMVMRRRNRGPSPVD